MIINNKIGLTDEFLSKVNLVWQSTDCISVLLFDNTVVHIDIPDPVVLHETFSQLLEKFEDAEVR